MPGNKFYETIFKGVIFGSFFGIAYFSVDGLLKLAGEMNKLAKDRSELITQLADYKEEFLHCHCQRKLSQCKEAIN